MSYNNRDIRIEEIPTPSPGPGEMLVKVVSCGVCGSDIVEWYRLPRALRRIANRAWGSGRDLCIVP